MQSNATLILMNAFCFGSTNHLRFVEPNLLAPLTNTNIQSTLYQNAVQVHISASACRAGTGRILKSFVLLQFFLRIEYFMNLFTTRRRLPLSRAIVGGKGT